MATIREVALKAGVSVATVSRVLNKSDTVREQTKQKVEQAIRELNYEPSVLGRNLRNSQSKLLLILIPNISNPFYTKIIKGIEDTVIEKGYNILLCETNSNPKREAIYFNLVRNRLADGIISMDPTVDKEKLYKLASNYPIVQCSEYDESGIIPYVSINNELAAYHAVKHLIKLGNRKIALINFDEKFLYSRERYRGFVKALEEFEIPVNKDWVYHTDKLTFDSGQQAMRILLNQKEKPTAVFAVSDILAIGALKELNEQGLCVPQDLAIVGFDKISFSNMTNPTLTTVSQPMYKMGCLSAEMIIKKINGEEVNSCMLEHELVIRDST